MGEPSGRPRRPERFHSAIGLCLTLFLALGAFALFHATWTGWHVGAAWLFGVNATAFGYYGFDKQRARHGGQRVPEIVLHGLALAGGSAGAFGAMQLFRHKTIKGRFRFLFFAIVLLQIAAVVGVGYVLWRRAA